MKLTNAFPIVLATLVPKVSFAQTCTDENGSLVGDSGILDIQLPGEKVNTNFIRRGSEENCPCSYVRGEIQSYIEKHVSVIIILKFIPSSP